MNYGGAAVFEFLSVLCLGGKAASSQHTHVLLMFSPVMDRWMTPVGTMWPRQVVITRRNALISGTHFLQVSYNKRAGTPQQGV